MAVDFNWLEENIIGRSLTAEEREALGCLKERRCVAGEKIMVEGEPCGSLVIVRSGRAKVEDSNRDEASPAEVESGSLLGELTLLNNRRRTTDVTALEACVVYSLMHDDFTRMMKEHHELACAILSARVDHQAGIIMSQRRTLAPVLCDLKRQVEWRKQLLRELPMLIALALYVAVFLSHVDRVV